MSEITLTLQPYEYTQLKAFTSRPLAEGEELRLLSCGKGRSRWRNVGWGKSRNRWHVKSTNPGSFDCFRDFHIGADNIISFAYVGIGVEQRSDIDSIIGFGGPPEGFDNFFVKKANHDNYWFPNDTKARKLCFAFAIYNGRKRVSNVAYFRINFRLAFVADRYHPDPDLLRWVTLT